MAIITPVALFVFNRPDTTSQVMAAIRAARPPRLLVVADGPRHGHDRDPALCRRAREIATRVDWPCEILTEFSEQNLGCRARIASGLDWVFGQADEAILLEDDCVPDPTFFPFCEELLARYRDDPRVSMISGANFLLGRRFSDVSYYFSRFFHVWGWASWARAWRYYDARMSRWPELRQTDWIERYLPTPAMARRARQIFDEAHEEHSTNWDYPWVLASWLRGAHAIVPGVNLVRNIGFGASATHLRDAGDLLANLATEPMSFPLRHPGSADVLEAADAHEWSTLNPAPRLGLRLRRLLAGVLRRAR